MTLSWAQKRDLYRAAVLIRDELEVAAPALPIAEVYVAGQKGGGRDVLEWAIDFLGCVPEGGEEET